MKFRSLFAAIVVAFATIFAGCENGSGVSVGGGDNDLSFDITVSDITSSGATVSVVPSDDTVIYYFDKVPQATYKAYKNDTEFMKAMIEALRSYVSESGGSLFSAISVGEAEYTFSNELMPETDYYIFAFGLDSKLNPNSKLTLKPFTTAAAKSSTNTFSIKVNGGLITVTPSNNDPYFWSVEATELYEGENDQFIMNDLISYYDSEGYLSYYIVSGVDSFDYSTLLTSGESYTVYAFGYEGAPTTALTKYTFTYNAGGSSGGSDDYATTTLTGDVTLNIAEVEAYYYDDYYDIGTNNWEIGFFNNTGYEFVYAEAFTALGTKTPEGNFTITYDAGKANTAFSGDIDEDGYIMPTYYVKLTASEDIQDVALIVSGSFSISKSGSNYSVSLNLEDELGNKVKGSYTGDIYIAKGELTGYSQSSASRANRRAAHCALRRFSSAAQIRPAAIAAKNLKTARVK